VAVPKSRVRKKAVYTPPPTRSAKKKVSPPWVAPVMIGLFLVGIGWLVAFYLTGGDMPGLRSLGNWNLLIGFSFIIGGFGMSTQWR
jgi:uncharacterized membrane protein